MDDDYGQFIAEVLRLRTQEPLAEASYHAISLLGSASGRIELCCQTQWHSFTPTKPRREVREAREVNPMKYLQLTNHINEPAFIVNDEKDIFIFTHFGGHAAVEVSLSERYLVLRE